MISRQNELNRFWEGKTLTRGPAVLLVPTIMFGLFAGILWFTGLRPLIAIPLLGWL